jgi:hypothetical protein
MTYGAVSSADHGGGKRMMQMPSLQERRAYHEAGHTTAALTFGIPVVSVSIADDRPHLHRARYRAHDADFGLEAIVTLCLAGPQAEREFCGPVSDDGDRVDYQMARRYLADRIDNPLQAAAELVRYRDAAQRLVRSPWAQQRICLLADALMLHGTLSGDEVVELIASKQTSLTAFSPSRPGNDAAVGCEDDVATRNSSMSSVGPSPEAFSVPWATNFRRAFGVNPFQHNAGPRRSALDRRGWSVWPSSRWQFASAPRMDASYRLRSFPRR